MDRAACRFAIAREVEMTKNQNPVSRRIGRCIVTLGAVLVTLSAHAQNAIEAVSGSIQGGVEVVRVDLKNSP